MEKIDKAKEFLIEAKGELKKVTWPTREQSIKATWVVIVMVILIAIFLGILDLALSKIVKWILR